MTTSNWTDVSWAQGSPPCQCVMYGKKHEFGNSYIIGGVDGHVDHPGEYYAYYLFTEHTTTTNIGTFPSTALARVAVENAHAAFCAAVEGARRKPILPPFKREFRYFVLKYNDTRDALTSSEYDTLCYLADKVSAWREDQGKIPLTAVVVESDWPQYEAVWTMIEAEAGGNQYWVPAFLESIKDATIDENTKEVNGQYVNVEYEEYEWDRNVSQTMYLPQRDVAFTRRGYKDISYDRYIDNIWGEWEVLT